MEDEELIKQYLASLSSSVDALNPLITQLIAESFEDRLNSTTDSVEQFMISNGYAYILVSLCFAYLKSQGVNTATHPIMKDLDRVKSYMNRAKNVAEGKDDKEVKVDTSVAKRFINSVLGSPAISSENFKGKHTKFEDDSRKKEEDEEKDVSLEIRNKLKGKVATKDKKSRKEEKNKVLKKKKKN